MSTLQIQPRTCFHPKIEINRPIHMVFFPSSQIYPHSRNTQKWIFDSFTTLQHTTIHCDTLQRITTHCNTLQHIATYCIILQHTAGHCNTAWSKLPCVDETLSSMTVVVCCSGSVLQCVSVFCSVVCVTVRVIPHFLYLPQCVTVCCSALQSVEECYSA